jgi:hypothetical protein
MKQHSGTVAFFLENSPPALFKANSGSALEHQSHALHEMGYICVIVSSVPINIIQNISISTLNRRIYVVADEYKWAPG